VEEADGKKVQVARDAGLAASADYADASRAVVVIGSIEHCKECDKFHMGAVSSGWVIDPRGRIATNYHVMEDKEAGEIGVMDLDGKVYPVRKVIAADRAGDAAIIEIDTGGAELRAFPLADSVETGERVRVIGHPDGRFYSLTEGIVSRVFTEAGDEEGKDRRTWITVTADYGSGSSGAPVLNTAGEVIGMVSSTAALLADTEQDKEPKAEDVQMVFRDCVSADTIRRLIAE
jgi:S1-C subfamily serine protease